MIVGLSGKKQSGKDTVGKLINYLFTGGEKTYVPPIGEFLKYYNDGIDMYPWETKQFAYKLKQIVCILIGCTMEQLEDNDFKEKELGEEWDYWVGVNKVADEFYSKIEISEYTHPCISEANAKQLLRIPMESNSNYTVEKHKYTPRKILQLMGTDCGRKIIHPNIWITSLMNEYKTLNEMFKDYPTVPSGLILGDKHIKYDRDALPNWIITDVRFPEEVKAIEDRNGIILRIDRPGLESLDTHESETALDDYPFEHRIVNDGSIEDLIEKIKDFLTITKILT